MRALRTGPTTGGTDVANTAAIRVSPPSTSSMYTTSADLNPMCGCAGLVLSILTMSTGLPAPPARPEKGEASEATALVAPGDELTEDGDEVEDDAAVGEADCDEQPPTTSAASTPRAPMRRTV